MTNDTNFAQMKAEADRLLQLASSHISIDRLDLAVIKINTAIQILQKARKHKNSVIHRNYPRTNVAV